MPKQTPHRDKLIAALDNPKCSDDVPLLKEIVERYEQWLEALAALKTTGKERVTEMVQLLNEYKDNVEVETMMKRGSPFLRRQKGQLKLDNSILEEFFVRLVDPSVIQGLGETTFVAGPYTAFMSMSFRPRDFASLDKKPEVVVKTKDQDFVIGAKISYKFAPNSNFINGETATGAFVLAVVAAECKINLDKTMYQEAAGTAARLKQGCPIAKYFVAVEYLDMEPEDCRLTDIDNVFLLRHAKRLPFEKRGDIDAVLKQRKDSPIDSEVVWKFVQEMQTFVDAAWYDPEAALKRGTFV